MFINLKPKKQDEVEKELIIMFAKERNKTIEQQKEIERLNNIIKEAQNYLRSTTHFILDYDKPWTKISKEEEQYTKRESDLRRILKGEKIDWLILDKGEIK